MATRTRSAAAMDDGSRPLRNNGYSSLLGGAYLSVKPEASDLLRQSSEITQRPRALVSPTASPSSRRLGSTATSPGSALEGSDDVSFFDPEASPREAEEAAFGVGERVSYYSASHNQWLAARVLRPNYDEDGLIITYDLDVRRRAEPCRMRRCLPDFHGDEESVKRRIENFRPALGQRWSYAVDFIGLCWKRATSHGELLWLRRSVKFVAFAMEPFVDAVSGTILLINRFYVCASACLLFMLAPCLVLWVAYRCSCKKRYRMQLRAEAFSKSIGRTPGLWSIIMTDMSVVLSELQDTTTLQAQNYVTLRHTVSLMESCPMGLFQLAVGLVQAVSSIKMISPFWLAISIPWSFFNAYMAYSSMILLGSLTQEGDLPAHLESLIRLSTGAAPPHVLERILEEQQVVVTEDLTQLNRQGFRSLARAMGRSQVAESVTFRNTGLDRFVNLIADETERANLWAHFCCDFCDNHFVLESVNFTPTVAIPRHVWQEVRRFNVPVLGQVWNGAEIVYEREAPLTLLDQAARADDVVQINEALQETGIDLGKVRVASMTACCFDHWRSLQALLLHLPANVREPMMLSHAAENGAQSCLKLLLAAKSHPDAKGRAGLSALEMAALKGYSGVVKDLLAASASPDLCGSFTPLASVAFSNSEEIACALLKAKANIHHQHRNDAQPIHIAAREGATEVVMALLNARAGVNAQESKDYLTPLHFAAQRGNVQVVRLLLKHRASLHSKSQKNNSALHSAAWEGMMEVVQVLLHAAADPTSRNGSGCTALDFAMERNRDDIVALLNRKEGATV